MSKFFVPALSTMILATFLTPEMTSSLAIVVAAFFVGLVNFYVARTSRLVAMREVTKTIAPIQEKIDQLVPVVAKIDAHVNSEKTRAQGENDSLKLQIELKNEMIEEMRKAAALLAQAKATTDMTSAVAQAAVAGATVPVSLPSHPVPVEVVNDPLVTDQRKTL